MTANLRKAAPGSHDLRDTVLIMVIPTLNEADNIDPLLERLRLALGDLDWAVVFVDDDSGDGTREHIARQAASDPRIHCIHRKGRQGLSGACLEGIRASDAPFVGIMDADLQHDESLLPVLYDALAHGGCDLAIGSRYVAGGGVGTWHRGRQRISRWATRLTRWLTGVQVEDPMSGFFMFRRSSLESAVRDASGLGFKLLLDLLLATGRPLQIREFPYEFRSRRAGTSKLSTQVAWQLVLLILDKKVGRLIPARYVSFALVGASGVLVHFVVLALLYRLLGAEFMLAQACAALMAMTTNFLLNNRLTFGDRALQGIGLLRGWLSFVASCSIGAVANVGIAQALFSRQVGWALSALAGVLVGSVWNYATTAVFTWKQR